MKKLAIPFFFCLLGLVSLASAQNRPVGGAFAAVPAPGQPAAPVTPTPTAPPTPGVARPATPQAPGAKPEEQLRIVADPSTNSLIIYGTGQEFQNIKNILKEIDIVPRQVLMDVLVAEVTLTDTESFGIAYEIFRGNTTIFNRTFPSAGAVINPVAPSTGGATKDIIAGALSGFPSGISGIAGRSNAIRAFINALATENRIRTLASPSVLATDNHPARIQVGSEIPILTSTSQSIIENSQVINSVQYRNTGVILTIIPQVNSQGLVHLQVKQEVSDVGSNSFGNTNSPSFTTRDAETTAVVQDGETLAIGGIISDRRTRDRTGIPYLMNLPVLGRFFGTTLDNITRTELVILITPHVVRNKEEARDVTAELKSKLSAVRSELERMRRDREKDLEKLKSQTPEQPKPAEPPAPPTEPARPPVSAPTRPGAYFSPITSPAIAQPDVPLVESAVRNNDMPPVMERQDGLEMLLADIETAREPTKNEKIPLAPDAVASSQKTRGTPQPVRVETESAAPPAKKSAQRWVVQVAAMAQAKDADLLCKRLRDKGYDAQVNAADVAGKTWHRVQVGGLASRQEAFELQKNLKSSEKLEQAFVALR